MTILLERMAHPAPVASAALISALPQIIDTSCLRYYGIACHASSLILMLYHPPARTGSLTGR